VTLFESDLPRLNPGEFLNDSIIEFYFKYGRLSYWRSNRTAQPEVFPGLEPNRRCLSRADTSCWSA
jgi:Ulp1 family protease